MGEKNPWSDNLLADRAAHRKATGAKVFAHDDDIRTGRKTAGVHDLLNPYGVIRECLDSENHPEPLAGIVILDVTGSMKRLPGIFVERLKQLMGLVLRGGYVDHPQWMFVAVGDATCDRAPLQVGQFEASAEMEDDLGRMYLEGNGGGQKTESYEL